MTGDDYEGGIRMKNRCANLAALSGLTLALAGATGCGSGGSSSPPPPPLQLKTFITASQFDGDLITAEGTGLANGILAADALCVKDANYPGAGTYKALLVDGVNRIASVSPNVGDGQVDWVLKPNAQYYQSDGTTLILTTNGVGLFVFGTLDNPFDPVALEAYWTGLDADWTTFHDRSLNSQNCDGWSYNASTSAPFGTFAMSTETGSKAIFWSNNAFCNQVNYQLVCVEQ